MKVERITLRDMKNATIKGTESSYFTDNTCEKNDGTIKITSQK